MLAVREKHIGKAKSAQKAPVYDFRFRYLVGEQSWARLPRAVQTRFSKRLADSALANYQGSVIETRHSRLGWLFAQICRVIGAPLPLCRDPNVPAVVIVSEDRESGGQCWTRIYGRERGFPQVIHSAKRFAGSTGLEEYLGNRLGMALSVEADEHGLVFRSDHYFVCLFGKRIRIPHCFGPGETTVIHRDLGDRRFAFDLDLAHPLFGELVHQHAEFRDA
ncbi:DUF4166 domain-containing protein [Pontixanthobacter aestiaquae]|uniref:DUF4166 domain-containing protein n=1 Tax=Pontixanthobacter aestiaquae TaxID=1509367 RepID=A0A844Z809_9SPHN|nr:DUF4166 domain-containing protein [Pontixanthobacter aestiaquae]MDN3645052.1 DUF4166 domain-containing protein [Pontixanthobacter aestiaquae]MXO83948.1 DUF4166 domain-containing protein [Pontixanthobacter aestiaquae]